MIIFYTTSTKNDVEIGLGVQKYVDPCISESYIEMPSLPGSRPGALHTAGRRRVPQIHNKRQPKGCNKKSSSKFEKNANSNFEIRS